LRANVTTGENMVTTCNQRFNDCGICLRTS